MTSRFDRRRPQLPVFVVVAIWASACSSPTSSASGTITLAGVVRDTAQQPVDGARLEIIGGQFGGRFTMSNTLGRFQFDDPPSVAEPVTLRVSKAGYLNTLVPAGGDQAIIVTIPAEPAMLPSGEYSLTFTAADTCTMLPAGMRSRTYLSMLSIWQANTSSTFSSTLTGADFFPGLHTMSGVNRDGAITLGIFSDEALRRWGDELPLYERVSATEYLSLFGRAKAGLAGVTTSLTTALDGTIAYCGKTIDPIASGFPPQCTVPALECRSNDHRLTILRR